MYAFTDEKLKTADAPTVLSARDVSIAYRIERRWLDVVRNVSLDLQAGRTYGLVGESGSGKTTFALSLMRYLPANGRISSGHITLDDEDLIAKPIAAMRNIWGAQMAMVPQDPGGSLNPSLHIGDQIAEIFGRHTDLSGRAAWNAGIERLKEVRIADPERVANAYPHQLSGGMQQRVLIAMALATDPRVLLLDEPTTNLDVTTEAAVLDLINELVTEHNTATLYVTHNLGVVAQVCDRAAVLYAGEMMEDAPVEELFARPLHPYTMELISCVPKLGEQQRGARLRTIKGQIPSQAKLPTGCIFAPRCALALDYCFHSKPKTEEAAPGHSVKCHRWPEIAEGLGRDILGVKETQTLPAAFRPHSPESTELLNVDDVTKRFEITPSLLDSIRGKPAQTVKAVDGVTLHVHKGETIGIVGESGSGKTTLARTIVGLIKRDGGTIDLTQVQLAPGIADRDINVLRKMQMVFQNPEESLNPFQTVAEAIRRPLIRLGKYSRTRADERIRELLRAVHLQESYADRYPAELSGGEKQRVAIARALATSPELVVCDESVSALDVSVQASILNLLTELKISSQIAYLFISHDLSVVSYLADTIAVVYLGEIMEIGSRDALFSRPVHPYTEALISAVPSPDPTAKHQPIRLEADIPSPINLPTGCRFHTRCPRKIGAICETTAPPFQDAGDDHYIRCHIPLHELALSVPLIPSTPIADGLYNPPRPSSQFNIQPNSQES